MRTVYELGPFRLDTEARVLTQDGVATPLGARGVAVLATLVSRAGEYVDKSAIVDAAWPGLVVDENNLAVQISAIRRVLARAPHGTRWIETLSRRGYRFVGPAVEINTSPSPSATAGLKRTNLPQLLQSFIGRERELAEIKQLLPRTRLLTLTGTGGIGKTRLALQAASEVRDAYRDGAWFVDLAPLADPGLVPSALAQVLGVKESVGQSLVKTLIDHLQPLEVLLVLDNCEHVLDACARLAEALLGESAGGTFLATSREPLRIGAERMYPLGTLSLPDPQGDAQSIAQADSVRLFVDRARQHRPSFDLQGQRARAVAELCVRLDGIPLALELAAARMAVLPVEQIVRLLHQRFRLLASGSRSDLPRHQTLRALLDWSYELLDEAERQLFARLSVFAGGWTLAAAEAVGAGEGIAKDDVVYLLIALVEKSLVVADDDGDRYRMLETVREYAREKLATSGTTNAVRERHRNFFLALAVSAESLLAGPEQAMWLQHLEDEHDNLRSALEYCLLAASGSNAGLRLCGAVHWFWVMRGYRAEGLDWCVRALGIEGIKTVTPERAMALEAAGVLAYHLGRFCGGSCLPRRQPRDRTATERRAGHGPRRPFPGRFAIAARASRGCPDAVRGSSGNRAQAGGSVADATGLERPGKCGYQYRSISDGPVLLRGKPRNRSGRGKSRAHRHLVEQPGLRDVSARRIFGGPRAARGKLGDPPGTQGFGRNRLLAQWPRRCRPSTWRLLSRRRVRQGGPFYPAGARRQDGHC